MAELAYNLNRSDNGYAQARISQSNWTRVGSPQTGSLGFSMNVYHRPVGNGQYDYVFAFRGTVDLPGWWNNLNQVIFGSESGQIQEAERLVESILNDISRDINEIHFTGHSLGGYLSQWMEARIRINCGTEANCQFRGTSHETSAVTFNAPGFAAGTTGTTSFHIAKNEKIANSSSFTSIRNYQISSFLGDGMLVDPVVDWGTQLGNSVRVSSTNYNCNHILSACHALAEFFDILRFRSDFLP